MCVCVCETGGENSQLCVWGVVGLQVRVAHPDGRQGDVGGDHF